MARSSSPEAIGERPHLNLDAAASTSAFSVVEDRAADLLPWYSSVHRGAGYKSQLSTAAYEDARQAILGFAGAPTAVTSRSSAATRPRRSITWPTTCDCDRPTSSSPPSSSTTRTCCLATRRDAPVHRARHRRDLRAHRGPDGTRRRTGAASTRDPRGVERQRPAPGARSRTARPRGSRIPRRPRRHRTRGRDARAAAHRLAGDHRTRRSARARAPDRPGVDPRSPRARAGHRNRDAPACDLRPQRRPTRAGRSAPERRVRDWCAPRLLPRAPPSRAAPGPWRRRARGVQDRRAPPRPQLAPRSVRASCGISTTGRDIDRLVEAVHAVATTDPRGVPVRPHLRRLLAGGLRADATVGPVRGCAPRWPIKRHGNVKRPRLAVRDRGRWCSVRGILADLEED